MDDDGYEVFEGFGSSGTMTTQPHQEDTIANWADMLVDAVFNDPDCERLQVTSIVSALKEIGFPNEYASKVRHLEQQLDPKNEGVNVGKVTLRKVVRLWLQSCHEETDAEECPTVDVIGTKDDNLNSQAGFYDDVHHNKEDHYKNEISCLDTTLNPYEDKFNVLLHDHELLKRSEKNLKAALQKAEEDKVLTEESKAAIKGSLKTEKFRRITEVSALDKQLVLANDQLETLNKENLEYDCIVKDLRNELVVKHNELEEYVQENIILKRQNEQLKEKLWQAEKEITQLTNTNFELVEHGKEWKKTIQNLKEEKNVLSKKLLIISSRIKTGKKADSSPLDFGSDSSNIGEISTFSPTCFSSPVGSEKLSIELAGSLSQEPADMESTNRMPRPVNHPTEESAALIPDKKRLRKRKLFAIQVSKSNSSLKRCRSNIGEVASRVFNNCFGGSTLAMLPLERSTSFTMNLTIHQKLLESLQNVLCLNPHLFGCIRDFVASQAGNRISVTELLDKDLTPLFYEFCPSQASMSFRGRQHLKVTSEELSTQCSSSALQRCKLVIDEASQPHSEAASYILEFENSVISGAVQTTYPLAITESQIRGIDSTNFGLRGHHTKRLDILTLTSNVDKLKYCAAELETIPAPANPEKVPSSFVGDEIADIDLNCMNSCTEFFNNSPKFNDYTCEQELGNRSRKSDLEGSDTLVSMIPTSSQESNIEDSEGEGQGIGRIDLVPSDGLLKNSSLLCSDATEMVGPPSSSVISTCAHVATAVKNEPQDADEGCESAHESDEEFHSSQCLLIDPSFQMYADCNSEQGSGSSVIDSETPGVQPNSGIVPPNGDHLASEVTPVSSNVASRAGCLKKPVKSRPCRWFKFMMIFVVCIFLLICWFFGVIFLAKILLPEAEYVSLILALGGKYHRHEPLVY